MFRRTLSIIATLAMTSLVSGPALAHGMGEHHGMMHGGPGGVPPSFMMSLRAANLTPDQQTKIHDIFEKSHKTIGPLFEQLHSIDQQISAKLLGTGPVTAADLQPLENQAEAIHKQIDAQTLADAIAIRGVLTADQIGKMAAFNQKMSALHDQIETLMKSTGTGDVPALGGPPPME